MKKKRPDLYDMLRLAAWATLGMFVTMLVVTIPFLVTMMYLKHGPMLAGVWLIFAVMAVWLPPVNDEGGDD
jgi:CBS-domain-containing membrane protein